MNLTHKKTPINSHRTAKKNNLLQAAKLIICEERQELQHVSDLSRGRGPFLRPQPGWPALQVSGGLQETAARSGAAAHQHSLGGTRSKPREGRAAGGGRQKIKHTAHKATQRSSAYKNIAFLQAEKPFMFKFSFCPGHD